MVGGGHPKHKSSESPPPIPEAAVKETHRISIDYNPVSGRKKLNTYEVIRELGRGEHGRVKLGYDVDKNVYVAIKLLNRKEKPRLGRPQGSSTEEKIHREIAILKKCSHPNIVRLIEVLDDESSRKIYLVLEYCAKGEIKWQTPDGLPKLTREQARSVARNVASGLEYLHANGIIHRDIKPANLLVSEDDVVKISDFGVSYAVSSDTSAKSELELAKTVGTPAFFSPELCIPTEVDDSGERKTPPISSKVDVWAFGVTLYCFLYGDLPFEADNEYELFRVIANEQLELPDPGQDEDLASANDLLQKLLTKDPCLRPSISEAMRHPWLLKNLSASAKKEFLDNFNKEAISVSNEEVDEAVKGVNIKSRIKQSLSRIAEQIRPRSRSRSRSQSGPSSSGSSTETHTKAKNETTVNRGLPTSRIPSGHSTMLGGGSNKNQPTPLDMANPVHGASPPYNCSLDSSSSSSEKRLPSQGRQVTSAAAQSSTTRDVGPGLMPMSISETSSLGSSSQAISIDNLSLNDSNNDIIEAPYCPINIETRLPELEIPRLDNDSLWGPSSSSSSEDDDSGELTLVVGRNRSRSVERGRRTSPTETTTEQ